MSGLRPVFDSDGPRSLEGLDSAELGALAAAGFDSAELDAEAGLEPPAAAGRGCAAGTELLPALSAGAGVLDDCDLVA